MPRNRKLSRRRKRRSVPVPTASMGDIAFLLIIFFLVCSETTQDAADIQVTLPSSARVEKAKPGAVARVAIDKDGQIYFNGSRVDSAKDIEVGISALVTTTVSEDQRHVQFRCDAGVTNDIFEPVLSAIAEGGGILNAIGTKKESTP